MSKLTPEQKMLEEAILVNVYNVQTHGQRQQLFKRTKLVGRKVIFTAKDGNRKVGVCWGFSPEGGLLVFEKEGQMPAPGTEALFVEGARSVT